MAKHLASFALIGITGKRVGTRFVFKVEDIPQAYPKPHFRFRNDEIRIAYRRWLDRTTTSPKGDRDE